MPFISYAQNLEDVMLYRALRDVQRGFYVDVGANSPDQHSVTRALYERGWRGINIEPVPAFHEQLVAARPGDINLAIAVGDRTGVVNFHDIPDTGLSTVDQEVARQHRLSGYRIIERQVPVETLDHVFETQGVELVHFLKIDVEGHESAVLRGLSLKDVRPWIIVIEATAPLSQDGTHLEWDPLLTGRGYHYVYFDGLNRYYIADEKPELAERFASPPNIFDDWIRAHDWAAHELVGNLSRRITGEQEALQAEREVRRREAEARLAEVQIRQTEAELRHAETATRQAEADALKAETDALKAEAEASRAEASQAEAALRHEEAGLRAKEAELREKENGLRDKEAALREKEAGLRQAEVLVRQKEADARFAEIEIRQAELTRREAEVAAWIADTGARSAEWTRITDENTAFRHRIAHLEAVAASLESYIGDVRASSSWRLTAPVRGVRRLLGSVARMIRRPTSPRPALVALARRIARWAAEKPAIKNRALPILLRHPLLERKARALLAREHAAPAPPPVPAEAPPPSPAASPNFSSAPAPLAVRSLSLAERTIEAAIRRAQARAR